MIFENLIKENKEQFINEAKNIALELNIPVEWLIFVMWFESGLNSKAVNFQKGDNPIASERCKFRATGLIQFMPTTARNLGTTNTDLYNMSNVKQLGYVKKYLSQWKGKFKSFEDLYLAVFYPAAIG